MIENQKTQQPQGCERCRPDNLAIDNNNPDVACAYCDTGVHRCQRS